jgi:hypothetical protein
LEQTPPYAGAKLKDGKIAIVRGINPYIGSLLNRTADVIERGAEFTVFLREQDWGSTGTATRGTDRHPARGGRPPL